jgi:2,4-dienoyl-CoA reductase-like NADH-dependent reductase (Old Yellow Enzyme family)/thioredoxin reductase
MGSNGTTQLRIDNDQYLPGLWEFNERMHEYGACTSIQLNHAGASAYPGRLNGVVPISSSDVPSKTGNTKPRPLMIDEIDVIVKKYGEAANRAIRAGFDCVEIHAGHSYLISQFLSPIYNKRTDEFGGSKENRARFGRQCIDEVRKVVGPHHPIVLRFSADEFLEGGNTLEDTLELLAFLTDEVDILNVSAALNDSIQYQIDKMNLKDGWRAYMAKAVKEKFPDKVVMTSGNIRCPKRAAELLENGEADLLGMGRGLIAEPNWVNKVRLGQAHLLRKCISCNIGCADHRISKSKPIRCTVNPDLIHEDAHKRIKLEKPVKMVVIGGGTAGLEAATSAAEIGADVTLFEKKEYLGGLAHEIARFPDKTRINDFVTYLENRANMLANLDVRTGTEATLDGVATLDPDVIVNATGATPLLPPIEGLHEQLAHPNRKVFTIFDILGKLEEFQAFEGKRVAIIGGGAVGLDVMEYYAERGAKEVCVIEMQSEVGKDLDLITKASMMDIAREYGVKLHTETKLVEVGKDYFLVEKATGRDRIEFDLGFVCLGMKAEAPLMDRLMAYVSEQDIELVNIGDSKRARRIMEGTREARDIVRVIERISHEKKLKGVR